MTAERYATRSSRSFGGQRPPLQKSATRSPFLPPTEPPTPGRATLPTASKFDRTKNNTVLQLPGRWETNESVSSSIEEILKYDLAPDYYKNFDKNVRTLTLEDVRKVSKQLVMPDKMTWFVIGDKEKIISGLKEVGFTEIVEIDADGNTIKPADPLKTESKK